MNFFTIIVQDIRNRKNTDIYITLVVALVIALLGGLGIVPTVVVSSGILGVLSLLSYSLLTDRHERSGSSSNLLGQWDEANFRPALLSAKEISGIYVTSYVLMEAYDEEFKEFLRQGGKLRVIFVKPKSTAATMASQRGSGADAIPEHLQSRLILSLEKLREISEAAPDPNSVKVKFVDFLPATAITVVNHSHLDGVIFVTIAGFGVNTKTRPSFIIRKETDKQWFEYFEATFEHMWDWGKCESIDLKAYLDTLER